MSSSERKNANGVLRAKNTLKHLIGWKVLRLKEEEEAWMPTGKQHKTV